MLAVLAGIVSGCAVDGSGAGPRQGPFRLVRFIETRTEGNLAMVSETADGKLLVSHSALAAWSGDEIWLLGRGNLLALRDGGPEVGPAICDGAAAILHAGRYLLVSCPRQGRVDVFDDASLALVQRVDTCQGVSQMASGPTGRTVFVRCKAGLAMLAGWAPTTGRGGRSILLLSRPDELLALSEDGFFAWSYPGLPAVADWDVMEPEGRRLLGVGRLVRAVGDPEIRGDTEFSVTLELVRLSFGEDLTEVDVVQRTLKVMGLARSSLGNAAWDEETRSFLVPLPDSGSVLAVSQGCLGQRDGDFMVRSACGKVSSLDGRPGAMLPAKADPEGLAPLVWDRGAQILSRLGDATGQVVMDFSAGRY